jgi:hypothetical protein
MSEIGTVTSSSRSAQRHSHSENRSANGTGGCG